MSTKLREIRRRISSTRQIHKVTSALQRVAAARLGRDRRVIEQSQMYTDKLLETMRRIGAAVPESVHPLMERRSRVRRVALVAFGSDRGLCGSYNTDVLARLKAFVAQRRGTELHLLVMGAILARKLRRDGRPADRVYSQPATNARGEVIRGVVDGICDRFLKGDFDEVHVLYSRFAPTLRHQPVVEPVLPACLDWVGAEAGGAEFEPRPEVILSRLVPEFVYQMIDRAFLSSSGAENWARQMAMSRASRNAGDMMRDLSVEYSRERQEHITTEMIELAGGGAGTRKP